MNIEINSHSSIKIKSDKIIYIDPFNIDKNYNDADVIFITHSHYDHFSEEDILKVKKISTKIVITRDLKEKVAKLGFIKDNILEVLPNKKYKLDDICITTVPAYNINKEFHLKEYDWVGYIIEIENKKVYIAGDTDYIEENKNINCDVMLVPVGGTYTMNYLEAAEFVNHINPKIAIPTHYGSIVGNKEDGEKFAEKVNKNIQVICKIM